MLYSYCFGKVLKIKIVTLDILSNIFSIIFQDISVFIIYKSIVKKEDKVISKIIYLIGAFLVIFNPLAIEHLAYFETCIISLGKLSCTIAAKKLIKDNKKIFSILLIVIASLSYQGILNVFITISLLFIFLDKDKINRYKIRKITEIGILCIISLVTMLLAINVGNYLIGEPQTRLGRAQDINYIQTIISLSLSSISIFTWNFFARYFLFVVIIISTLLLLLNKKIYEVLWYLILVILIVLSCTIPIMLQSTIAVEARIISSVGSIIRNISNFIRRSI